jgi:DNA-binding NtrC family response regulator
LQHLPSRITDIVAKSVKLSARQISSLRDAVVDVERRVINDILRFTGGNKVKAAKLLGVHRTVLYQKMKRYSIPISA